LTLLDSNVVIGYLKGDPAIVARIQHTAASELALPAVVVYELEYGTLRSKIADRRRRQLEQGFAHIRRIPFDSDAAVAAARICFQLERRGSTIGPHDLMIAGTALSRGATLVTHNTAEFSRVPGLRTIDWQSP